MSSSVKRQVLQVLHQLLHAGHNGEAAAVGHLAEKHVEIAIWSSWNPLAK